MAYSKSQLEAIKNTLLASNQPILANQHREQIQSMIDEMYDAQSRADILVGVQADTITGGSDTFIVFRNGEAYQIPLSLLSANTLANLGDVFISNVADGETLVYNAVDERWENQNIFLGFALSNLEDVELISLSNGDILRYNSTSEKWENTSLATILSPYALLTDLNDYQLLSEKGQANGYAQLDSGAKLPISIIPDSVLGQVEYQGTWNAATNTPTLPATPLKKGDYYVVSADGTQFGIDFLVGDWIISNGTIWEKVDNTDAVTSVFGRLGNIVANASDYSAFYVTLDTTQTITANKTFTQRILIAPSTDKFSFLGFKQASGGSTGLNGFTSIHPIGTDRIGFSFSQGAGLSKDFRFSTSLLNNNISRVYTMPDASGTLALTSNLDAYVTLATSQTITGAKTFSLDSSFNGVSVGRGGGNINTNTAVGNSALISNTNAPNNTAVGSDALIFNTTGSENVSIGRLSLANNTTAFSNVSIGFSSMLLNTTGSQNVSIGSEALLNNTTGGNNVAIGRSAGRFIADQITPNTISTGSIYIGLLSRPLADNQTNQIVIGNSAVGEGSNTVTIGNSSITLNRFFGTMRIGTINNGAGDFITTDANGVLTKRTSAETLSDIGALGVEGFLSPFIIPITNSNGTKLIDTNIGIANATNTIVGINGLAIDSRNTQPLVFRTNDLERWSILTNGTFQSNGAQTIQTSTGNLTLATGGGNGNIILSPNGTGNVGIGTTTPTSKLTIGTGVFSTPSTNTSGLYTSESLGLVMVSNGHTFAQTNGNINAIITSAGNVGIGTTAPTSRLDMGNGALTLPTLRGRTYTLTNVSSQNPNFVNGSGFNSIPVRVGDIIDLPFGQTRTVTAVTDTQLTVNTAWSVSFAGANVEGRGAIVFQTNNLDRVTITSAGNVGIGTTTPTSKLSIVGLPTSAAGLSAGDIYNDLGILRIV